MEALNIRLYDIFRNKLRLSDVEAKELVETIDDIAEDKSTRKHEHTKELVHKDMQSLKEYIGIKFSEQDSKFATKEDLSGLRSELQRTIYLTSLGQLVAVVASVVVLILTLRK